MNRRRSVAAIGIPALAVFAVTATAVGILGLSGADRHAPRGDSGIPTETIVVSVDEPAEADLARACDEYRVADDQPRLISLPGAAAGCIVPVGTDQHGAIAVPSNIQLAGWFVDSAVPGQPGVSIIDGHVRGRSSPGIFSSLDELAPGDVVAVEFGDGSATRFRVIGVDSYTTDETAAQQFVQLPGVERQLTLITCGGRYVDAATGYDRRVIVRAEAVAAGEGDR